MKRRIQWATAMVLVVGLAAAAQTPYQPKFKGDPAKSESEAAALGYMRTVLRAQKIYYKKNNKYLLPHSRTSSTPDRSPNAW